MAQIKLNATYGMTGTLPAVSGANLTNLDATDLSGNLPALNASALTNLDATDLSGTLPALNASSLTNLDARDLENALPAISGASLTGISAGKVGQVLHGIYATKVDIASTTFTTISSSVAITPSATSSKIYVVCCTNAYPVTSQVAAVIQIYRDSSGLGGNTGHVGYQYANPWDAMQTYQHPTISALDSPSSTSSLTYTCKARYESDVSSGTITFNYDQQYGNRTYLTVMEILA